MSIKFRLNETCIRANIVVDGKKYINTCHSQTRVPIFVLMTAHQSAPTVPGLGDQFVSKRSRDVY